MVDRHCESHRYLTEWCLFMVLLSLQTLTQLCHSKYISFRMINFRLVNNTASSQGNGFWSAPLFIAKRSRNSWLGKMTIVALYNKATLLIWYKTLWLLRNNLFKCIFNIYLFIHLFIPCSLYYVHMFCSPCIHVIDYIDLILHCTISVNFWLFILLHELLIGK